MPGSNPLNVMIPLGGDETCTLALWPRTTKMLLGEISTGTGDGGGTLSAGDGDSNGDADGVTLASTEATGCGVAAAGDGVEGDSSAASESAARTGTVIVTAGGVPGARRLNAPAVTAAQATKSANPHTRYARRDTRAGRGIMRFVALAGSRLSRAASCTRG
jgi:hypothetical protein